MFVFYRNLLLCNSNNGSFLYFLVIFLLCRAFLRFFLACGGEAKLHMCGFCRENMVLIPTFLLRNWDFALLFL